MKANVMKTLARIFSPLLLLPVLALCQETPPKPTVPKGYHQHDGFYLSMNIGPALGGTIINASGNDAAFNEFIYRGPGMMIDLKIGGAIRENLILSFDIIGRTITGPEGEMDGVSLGSANEDVSAVDNSYGVGLTRYFMPQNIFISGSLGFGRMILTNKETDSEATSRWGPSVHLKAGKEWWVGKNWGLGASVGYGFTYAQDEEPPSGVDYEGHLMSHQFYLLFNTTFN
jgi:hypothetical protein